MRGVVAGSRPWNRRTFDEQIAPLPGSWTFVADDDELRRAVETDQPDFVFFLHWSTIVPASIYERVECVVFHTGDLPYGRGGSPVQNLIERGIDETVLVALRMTEGIDAGPVYARVPLSLAGTAESIFLRTDRLAAGLIETIVRDRPAPVPQEGEAVVFRRRTPDQSEIAPDLADLDAWERHIRMLDADGYPHAYLDHGPYRITFRRAARYDGVVTADATISLREDAR
jgi:methionyl-tRNA formyltransferase